MYVNSLSLTHTHSLSLSQAKAEKALTERLALKRLVNIHMYTHTHTHTQTHMYMYMALTECQLTQVSFSRTTGIFSRNASCRLNALLLVVKKKPVVREKETYCLEKRPIVAVRR